MGFSCAAAGLGYACPMSKLQTEFVKIAQSGACVDGREIKGQWLLDMAETYGRTPTRR